MISNTKPIALAITGASGSPYGFRLLECLLEAGRQVHLMVSRAGQVVARIESDMSLPAQPSALESMLSERYGAQNRQLRVFGRDQWTAPVASDNLIERAADVALKEQRKLILVVREMPLSPIHLENMLKLSRLGVLVMPACPGFYHRPKQVEELVDFVVARVLDHLSVEHRLVGRWGERHGDLPLP